MRIISWWDQLPYNGTSVHLSPLCVFLSLELHNSKRKNERLWAWVILSQCFAYPMMRHWHQRMSTQPRVAAACDGYQLRLFTRAHICKSTRALAHSRIRNSHVWFWSWSHSFECGSMWHCQKGCFSHSQKARDGEMAVFGFVFVLPVEVYDCYGLI